ncbi:MAG: NADP-specific glutamate dehydrogenase [Acidobacteriota bacterium]|nr:NADP-specific glutamate dehydrogenase [Acidobacteriota bacterium]
MPAEERRAKYASQIDEFMDWVRDRNPGEAEFHQAVEEFAADIVPYVAENARYSDHNLLQRITEPDRVVIFRVCWEDDQGTAQVNRGYRVQFNNAIGPYKGGMRFHPSVNLSILKFLGFEQIFKNSLTTLPMGGGKGGSNFDPKGKSDAEVMRFCQALMSELARHIGNYRDVPAGDIGVGAREVGYLFGQYKRISANFQAGVITGKGLQYGGSLIRTEATGYGCVYFVAEALAYIGDELAGKTCLVSGSGNVAQYTTEKVIDLGGKVVTLSDSSGYIYDPDGIDREKLAYVIDLKTVRRGRIHEYVEKYPNATFYPGEKPWGVPCDVAFPSATQNEIDADDAQKLVEGGCKVVAEGANMPTTLEGAAIFQANNVIFLPAKAANAGGVAVSGLEMSQNSIRRPWSREEVDRRLRDIMRNIHEQCVHYGSGDGSSSVDYVHGANVGGFIKVADAMLAYGIV